MVTHVNFSNQVQKSMLMEDKEWKSVTPDASSSEVPQGWS